MGSPYDLNHKIRRPELDAIELVKTIQDLQRRVRLLETQMKNLQASKVNKEQSVDTKLKAAIELLGPRLVVAGDVLLYPYLFTEKYSIDKAFTHDEKVLLCLWRDVIYCTIPWDVESLKNETWEFADNEKISRRQLAMLIRYALTGVENGPSLFDLMVFLGKHRIDRRVNRALGFDNSILDKLLELRKNESYPN